jgi:hypothetical protein
MHAQRELLCSGVKCGVLEGVTEVTVSHLTVTGNRQT